MWKAPLRGPNFVRFVWERLLRRPAGLCISYFVFCKLMYCICTEFSRVTMIEWNVWLINMFSYSVEIERVYWILVWHFSGRGVSSYVAQGYKLSRMWWQRKAILHHCWKQRYSLVSPVVRLLCSRLNWSLSMLPTSTGLLRTNIHSFTTVCPIFYMNQSVFSYIVYTTLPSLPNRTHLKVETFVKLHLVFLLCVILVKVNVALGEEIYTTGAY